MELRPDEQVIFDGHPSPKSILETYAKGDALALVVGAVLWFAVQPGIGVSAAIVIGIVTAAVGNVKRRGTRYLITNQRLYIRRGLLAKREQQTRLERVQDTATRQSFPQRLLGIGTVDFDTAGGDGDEDFSFVGVDDPAEVVDAVDHAQRALSAPQPAPGRRAGSSRRRKRS